jgi:dihydroxyacetone kinase-like predicted kinase
VAGIRRLLSQQDYLNKINVFPVPDGDTGTNMGFTMLVPVSPSGTGKTLILFR